MSHGPETRAKMIEYIRILKSIEDEMEPYREAKRELKKDFQSNGWLSREDISHITRAYRMLKKNESIDELVAAYGALTSVTGDTNDDS